MDEAGGGVGWMLDAGRGQDMVFGRGMKSKGMGMKGSVFSFPLMESALGWAAQPGPFSLLFYAQSLRLFGMLDVQECDQVVEGSRSGV